MLYRGSRLAEAADWRERNEEYLNALERAFLDASVTLRDREAALREEQRQRELAQAQALAAEQQARAEVEARGRTRLRRLVVGLVVLLVLAGAASIVAVDQWQTAIDERDRAAPAQLAAQSQATLRDFPQRGLLLAVEAQRAMEAAGARVPAADSALTEALSFASGTVLARQASDVTAAAVSHDSSRVAIGTKDGTVQVARLTDEADHPVAVLRGPREDVAFVGFSRNDRWLVVGYRDLRTIDEDDRVVRLWDLSATPPKGVALPGEGKRFGRFVMSRDGRWLVTVSTTDRTVRLWDIAAATPAARGTVLAGPGAQRATVAISPTSRWAAVVAGNPPQARLWDLRRGTSTALPGRGAAVLTEAAHGESSNARDLWVVTHVGATTTLWDLTRDDPTRRALRVAGGIGKAGALTTSRDGRWLVGAAPSELLIWELDGSRAGTPARLDSEGVFLESVAISPNSHWLVATASTQLGYGGELRVVALDTPAAAGAPTRARFAYGAAATSRSGRWAGLTDPATGILRILDLGATSGPVPSTFDVPGFGGEVTSFFVTADDRWLVDAVDKTVRVLGLESLCAGAECTITPIVLHGHDGKVTSATVSPNRRWLVTTSADRTTRVWDFPAGPQTQASPQARIDGTNANRATLIARACRIAGRNLTADEWRTYFPDKGYRKTCPGFSPA